eukprot:603266-Prorocentrum_minimum.AAC.1
MADGRRADGVGGAGGRGTASVPRARAYAHPVSDVIHAHPVSDVIHAHPMSDVIHAHPVSDAIHAHP